MHQFSAIITSILLLTGMSSAQDSPAQARIRSDITRFSSSASRVAGSHGADAAADYIEHTFTNLGLQNVIRHTFKTIVPQTHHADLTIADIPYKIDPVWPNGVRTATTDGPVSGHVVWAGSVQIHDYNGQDLNGAIVFLDGDTGVDWFNAPMLGAAAVVFIENERMTRPQADFKFATAPIATPRYWMPRADGDRIHAAFRLAAQNGPLLEAQWSSSVTRSSVPSDNLFGLLPGSDPEWSDRTIVLSAHYDGTSIVPDVGLAAEGAIMQLCFWNLPENW